MLVTFCFPILVFLLSLKLSRTPQKTALQCHPQKKFLKKNLTQIFLVFKFSFDFKLLFLFNPCYRWQPLRNTPGQAADSHRTSVDTRADSLQEHVLTWKAVNSPFPISLNLNTSKFTNCALLWLIMNRFPDMSSKVQLHLSGGTKGERELPRGLGCLPVMADILRKETLPQRDTEREQFYRELMTCVSPVTGIMPWALNPSTNMQNNLLSRYHHYCHFSGNTIEVHRKPSDLDRTSEKTRSVFSLSPRRY